MSFAQLAAGLAAGLAGSALTSAVGYYQNKKLMKQNNEYQKEFAQNGHQWEVEDLQKAGLNPILSAGSTGATASGGGITGNGNLNISDPISAYNSLKQTESNIELQNKQGQLAETESGLKEAEKTEKNLKNQFIPEETKERIKNIQTDSAKKNAETMKNNAEINNIESQIKLNTAKKAETEMNTKLIRKQKEKMTTRKGTDTGVSLGFLGKWGAYSDNNN